MTISPTSPARNGNPGIVPGYLANPHAVPAPPAAGAGKLMASLAPDVIESRLESVDLKVPTGLQELTDARSAADAIANRGQSSKGLVGGQTSKGFFDQLDLVSSRRPAAVGSADRDAAMGTLRKVQGYFSDLGVGSHEGNGSGLPVMFDPTFPNAAYVVTSSGKEALQIGNDPETGVSYGNATDVLAHEYTHRVVNNMLGLRPRGESGAVNESLADTFASAIDTNDWTIGEDVKPGGLRSMDNPERAADALQDQYGRELRMPGKMDDFVRTPDDHGGVHINVGIPNKAASAIGKTLGRDTMAQIYIDAIRNYMAPTSGIADTARATIAASLDRFGTGSREVGVVVDAWKSVGLVSKSR